MPKYTKPLRKSNLVISGVMNAYLYVLPRHGLGFSLGHRWTWVMIQAP